MIKKLIKNLKKLRLYICNLFVANYTQEYKNNKEQQCWEIKYYKNKKYTHTVNMHYFTKKQIEQIEQNTYYDDLNAELQPKLIDEEENVKTDDIYPIF